jgi:hypothetical protein
MTNLRHDDRFAIETVETIERLDPACSLADSRAPTDHTHFQRLSDGAYRDRTGDLRLAKPALSQLS